MSAEGEFSFFTAVAFTLNYIIGTGFLTLPWAFERVGLVPSVTLLALLTVFACASTVYVLETMARATTMRHLGMCSQSRSHSQSMTENENENENGGECNVDWNGNDGMDERKGILAHPEKHLRSYSAVESVVAMEVESQPALFRPFDHDASVDLTVEPDDHHYLRTYTELHLHQQHHCPEHRDVESRLPTGSGDGYQHVASSSSSSTAVPTTATAATYPLHRISGLKFEVTELCELFLGMAGKSAYTALVGIYLYGTLAAYSTVFANALSQRLSVFNSENGSEKTVDYYVFLGVFAAMVTPLSCMELNEQIYVQIALSLCRVVMLVFMVGSVFLAESNCAGALGQKQCISFSDYDPASTSREDTNVFSVHFDMICIILPLIGYANIFHHSIPSLAQPVAHKRSLHSIFIVALFICSSSYATVSCVLALYFKDHINSSANLNWLHYTGMHGEHKSPMWRLMIHYVSYYVVLFPALDVASAFPLNAITLGNSIQTFFSERAARRGADPSTVANHTTFYRLVAVIPAILVACFVKDLTVITSFTGLTGFSIAFIIPALLALRSEQTLIERGIPCQDTQYSCFRENEWIKLVPRSRNSIASVLERVGFYVNILLLKLSSLLSHVIAKWSSVVLGVYLSVYVFYHLMSHGVAD